jgi:hypothetical protein
MGGPRLPGESAGEEIIKNAVRDEEGDDTLSRPSFVSYYCL